MPLLHVRELLSSMSLLGNSDGSADRLRGILAPFYTLDPLIVIAASLVGTTGPPTRAGNVVIVLQSRADLNPHGSDLRKLAMRDIAKSLTNDICAGQGRVTMCPRLESQLTYMAPIALTAEFVLGGSAELA